MNRDVLFYYEQAWLINSERIKHYIYLPWYCMVVRAVYASIIFKGEVVGCNDVDTYDSDTFLYVSAVVLYAVSIVFVLFLCLVGPQTPTRCYFVIVMRRKTKNPMEVGICNTSNPLIYLYMYK